LIDTADVKAFFDEVASDWDTMRLTYYDERVIDQLAAHTQLTGDQTVIDVGTGTGFVAAGLAAHAHRVLGYDNSPSMLEVARANLDRLGIDNVELAEGDLADLPLADGAVDATVANMVLHHATDPAAMIAEMARVTRAGGWSRSPTRSSTRTNGCAPSMPMSGLASPATRSKPSSPTPASSATATRRSALSETSSPRLRSKSPTSPFSSRGVR
jgi:ubiquinone/menaquinone biosynthesis C-methylase UbiE